MTAGAIKPGPSGKECVWDYPRPPRLEPTSKQIRVEFAGVILADSDSTFRVLETSHPPVYYIPPGDVAMQFLVEHPGSSDCEWKGRAGYYSVVVGGARADKVAWFYADPTPAFFARGAVTPPSVHLPRCHEPAV